MSAQEHARPRKLRLRRLKKDRPNKTKKKRRYSWLAKSIMETKERVRQQELARVDLPILAIQGVARVLRVTVETIRKISLEELPFAKKPGRRNLYQMEDILRYHRSKINEQQDVDKNSRRRKRLIDSEADSVRGRSS